MSAGASGLERVCARNSFYRRVYHRTWLLVAVEIIVIVVLSVFLHYQQANFPMPKYFPTTADGKLIDLPARSRPYVSDKVVLQWTKVAVAQIYSLDFANYRQALQKMRPFFTAEGHRRYLQAWKDSNNLEAVQHNKQVVYSVVSGAAKIIGQKRIQDTYTWTVVLPLTTIYTNSFGKTIKQQTKVLAKLARVDTLQNKYGLAIYQIILESA